MVRPCRDQEGRIYLLLNATLESFAPIVDEADSHVSSGDDSFAYGVNAEGGAPWLPSSTTFALRPTSLTSELQEAVPPTISTPWVLHRLYWLDPSSIKFLRRLHSLTRHGEEEQYLSSLQGPGLARLWGCLDLFFSSCETSSTGP